MRTSGTAKSQIRVVDTYERFARHIAAWLDGEIQHLLVVGPGGTGKSRSVQSILGNRPHHAFKGRQTPFFLYGQVCDHPDWPIVLDDIAALLRDAACRDLMKQLTELGERVVRWGSTTSKLEGRPTSFRCTAPVLVITNSIPERDADLEAILDRVDAIHFDPRKAEVIARMRELFPAAADQNLVTLIEELPVLPSLRTLVKARAWRDSSKLDLLEELYAECGVPEPIRVLVEIMESAPVAEQCALYSARTGLTDRTFRRHRAITEELIECRKRAEACPNGRSRGPGVAGTADETSRRSTEH